jgi:hypothetical protein
MKAIKAIFFLAFCGTAIMGCQSYGKEYKLDEKHNIYYKGDGIDEALAKKLAEYLKQEQYFQPDINATVQITKSKDTFNLNFVVDKSKIDAEKENGFLTFGGYISKNVFGGSPVTIHLCDDKMASFKDLGFCKPHEEEVKPEVVPGPPATNN